MDATCSNCADIAAERDSLIRALDANSLAAAVDEIADLKAEHAAAESRAESERQGRKAAERERDAHRERAKECDRLAAENAGLRERLARGVRFQADDWREIYQHSDGQWWIEPVGTWRAMYREAGPFPSLDAAFSALTKKDDQ
jgi:hypothetical protein